MSVSFRQFYVSRPSISPSSSTTGGTYSVAHRRINKLNQRSEISPITTGVALPATLTPQSYSDLDSLLRDEFLVSEDGLTWKIVSSVIDHIGALAIPAFDSAWADTTINSNQAATGFSLNFGDFSPSSEPSQTLYLLNIGANISSLTFNFLDLVSNSVVSEFAGLIEVSILGVYSALGNNPDLSFNQSLIWNLPQVSLNTVSVLLPNLSYAKIRIKLLNYPLGNLSSQLFNLSLSVVSNQTNFTLTYPNQWPKGSFLIDEDTPFTLPIVEQINATSVKVKPFQFNSNGVLRSNLFERTLTTTTGAKKLIFDSSNTLRIEPSTYTPTSGETLIASFTVNGADPFVTSLTYPWPIKPQSYLKLGSGSTLLRARFVTFSGSGIAYAETLGSELGVTLNDNSNLVATSGLCFIQTSVAVTTGQRLEATTSGKATPGNGPLIALQDGAIDQIIKAGFVA